MQASWSGPFGEAQACPPFIVERAKSASTKVIAIDPNFSNKVEFLEKSDDCFERVEENVYRHTSLDLQAYVCPTAAVVDVDLIPDIEAGTSLEDPGFRAKMLNVVMLLEYPAAIKIEKIRDYIFTVIQAGGNVCIADFVCFPMLIERVYNDLRRDFSLEERNRFTLVTHLFHCTTVQRGVDEARSTNALAILFWKGSNYYKDIFRWELSKFYFKFLDLNESISAILSSSIADEEKYERVCLQCEEKDTTLDAYIARLFPEGISDEFREYIADPSSKWPIKCALRETLELKEIDFSEEEQSSNFFQKLLQLYFSMQKKDAS